MNSRFGHLIPVAPLPYSRIFQTYITSMTKAHTSLSIFIKVNHMQPICPNCQSSNIATLNKARKIGGAVGAAISAINGAKAGAHT
jgi:hypothetical protein